MDNVYKSLLHERIFCNFQLPVFSGCEETLIIGTLKFS